MTGYEQLANAIIEQAADDYRKAARKIRRYTDHEPARAELRELERFFHSEWFCVLTETDGDYILRRLQKECGMK